MNSRNQPCPCGSGIKSKKCCQSEHAKREREAERAEAARVKWLEKLANHAGETERRIPRSLFALSFLAAPLLADALAPMNRATKLNRHHRGAKQ